ncbi:hypothetical protein [Xenorhabdus beddingii]|nr:hypothetical protein [Xenorhabdus beddingii]
MATVTPGKAIAGLAGWAVFTIQPLQGKRPVNSPCPCHQARARYG